VTFADAAAEYLRYIEHDRGRKPSTLRGYRSALQAHLLPAANHPLPSATWPMTAPRLRRTINARHHVDGTEEKQCRSTTRQ
jgi:site-specific recombinase XerC